MKNNFSKTFKRSFTAAAVAMTLSAAMPAMADNVNVALLIKCSSLTNSLNLLIFRQTKGVDLI